MKRVLIVILLLSTGCTAVLWHSPKYKTEYLNGFYINRDIHVLLASTETQGYVFPITKEVEIILSLSRSIRFRPTFKNFKINRYHDIIGQITLHLHEENLIQEDIKMLKDLGFRESNLNDNNLSISFFLKGKQYDIDGNVPLDKFQDKYKIVIEQPDSFSGTASKILATPVTIAIDAVVVLPASFLLATLWIMAEQ